MSFIKPFSEVSKNDIGLVGGKGLSLGRMVQANLPVPPGFLITTELHNNFKATGLIDDQTRKDLDQAFDNLGASRVAVRSSAISEDSDTASWAGQFESYMNVTKDALTDSIQDCWASVKGASDYAKTQDLKEEDLVVGVVIQKMVDCDVAGVAFSVNPLNHDHNEIMIEATYGLGELLVQGMVTPDNYVVSKSDKSIISTNIVTKTTMLVYKDAETKEVSVEAEKQEEACLSEPQLRELCDLICKIEDFYESPQDIEWGLHDSTFYVLQSRPITTI